MREPQVPVALTPYFVLLLSAPTASICTIAGSSAAR